jgi:hypothetical protein
MPPGFHKSDPANRASPACRAVSARVSDAVGASIVGGRTPRPRGCRACDPCCYCCTC